jgi:hypothetical protein
MPDTVRLARRASSGLVIETITDGFGTKPKFLKRTGRFSS